MSEHINSLTLVKTPDNSRCSLSGIISLTHEERELLVPYCECGCNGFWSFVLPSWMIDLRSSPKCIRNDFVKEEVITKLREKRQLTTNQK